jgi:starch synthase
MKIGVVTAEMAPLAKVGGLGDVAGALSAELAARGHEVTVLLPAYATIRTDQLAGLALETATVFFDGMERRVPLRRGRLGKLEVILLDDPLVAGRGPYDDADARDEAYRYALLSRVAADWLAPRCDLLQLHDHHAALAASMLVGRPRPAVLLTVHNMAFQGIHAWPHLDAAHLPAESRNRLDWYGRANSLKGALISADAVNAVSPTYAHEIRETEHGCGLQQFVRDRGDSLTGIVNGIDTRVWNPANDPYLAAQYGPREMAGKEACRAALMRELALPAEGPRRPLIGIVSRLTEQKGFDLLRPIMPEVTALADLAVLGQGDTRIEAGFRAASGRHVGVRIGFDEGLAHRVVAGSDLVLMPSRFEPCGLIQLIAMRYGTLPVVRRTGGLADTVVDADEHPDTGWGFQFDRPTPAALFSAIFRGLKAVQDGRGPLLARRGMAVDVSWSQSAGRYEALMAGIVAERPRVAV